MRNIVSKPWGYEYVAYHNNDVALKVLHIAKDERTSLHCHPNKSTGLVLLNGTAEINFIADSKILTSPAKQMIRRGLFHQTRAISENGCIMFEVETPVDKDDLVRLKDNYGRENKGYEGSQYELPLYENCLNLTEPNKDSDLTYNFFERKMHLTWANSFDIFDNKSDDDIIMFLQGGLVKTIEGRKHLVTQPGDVGQVKVVKQVAAEMDGFSENTLVLFII
jgi:mannose-6-phosphate isomerase-like protein (cupin superfamily)